MIEVILPNLGENVEKAVISYWYLKIGDEVTKDEDLVELTTDKATFNLPSPCSGTLAEIMFSEGEVVHIGDALASIEETI